MFRAVELNIRSSIETAKYMYARNALLSGPACSRYFRETRVHCRLPSPPARPLALPPAFFMLYGPQQGPLAVAQLLETPLLNLINYPSLIATNAARLRIAVGPDKSMLEFGLRRAQVQYGPSWPSPSNGGGTV